MNKIGSTRVITVEADNRAGLIFVEDEKLFKACQFRIYVNEEQYKLLDTWDKELLQRKKDKYDFVKNNSPYPDSCYVKVRLEYSKEEKQNIDKVITKVYDTNKTLCNELTLAKLNDMLNKSPKWKLTIKATSVYEWNNKKGMKYMLDKIELIK